MASPQHKAVVSRQSVGSSSCPNSPAQSAKPDRSADYAAVRNLAESYGVDLLPLEMGFTPLRTQINKSTDKVAQRFSTADSATDLPNTPDLGGEAASAGRGLETTYSAGSMGSPGTEAAARTAKRSSSPLKAAATADGSHSAEVQLQAAPASGANLAGYPIEVDGSDINTDSPSGLADLMEDNAEAEELYLDEEHLPIEERVALLEDERDMLVDKLLSTTEALHASEARNRQSEASQCQVQALLEQLQELLRRAEVERDRAKMQLKRHRASNSQFLFGSNAASEGGIPTTDAFTIGSLGVASSDSSETQQAPRPRTKKYKCSRGGAPPSGEPSSSSVSGISKAPSSNGAADITTGSCDLMAAVAALDSALPAQSTAQPVSGAEVDSSSADRGSGQVTAPGDADAATPNAPMRASSASVAALGQPGSRRSSGGDSSCSSSDAASPGDAPGEPDVTLTPSTDEARPPVRSVISGFEALLHRRRTPKLSLGGPSSGGGVRGRDRGGSSARTSASDSRSASPMTSRGGSDLFSTQQSGAVGASAAGVPVEGAAAADTPASQPAAPAESTDTPTATATDAAAEEHSAAAEGVAGSEQGPAAGSEVNKKTYVDAAVAGAQAERSRRSVSGPGTRQATASRLGGPASSCSTASTPTAAALCNTVPLGSYMLDSCFSEEEDVSLGGASVQHQAQAASPQEVYNPLHYTPARPVDGVFVDTADGGSGGGSLPGVKRGRSTSPAASPVSEQQQGEFRALAAAGVGANTSRSSPGSAFGSVISCEADSPATSTAVSGSSCPGAASPAGGHNSSSAGGINRGKARSASRLGLVTGAGSGGQDLQAHKAAGAGAAGQADSSRKQQHKPSPKGQGAQQRGSEQGAAKGSTRNDNSRAGNRRVSADATAEVDVVVTNSSSSRKAAPATSTGGRSKTATKKAVASSTQVAPTGSSSSTSTDAGIVTAGSSRMLLMLVVAAFMLATGLIVVLIWSRSQARLAAMQAQVQQLKEELSQASSCSAGLGLGGSGLDGEL